MRVILTFFFLICTAVSIIPADNSALQFRIQKLNGKEYVSLYEICRDGEFDQGIDPVLGRGKIYKKTYVAVYQIDLAVILAGREMIKSDYPVIRGSGGEVFIPADSAQNRHASSPSGLKHRLVTDCSATRRESATLLFSGDSIVPRGTEPVKWKWCS